MALGQDAIYEINVPATKKTIVREFNENIAIVYSSDGTDSWFSYVDMNTPDCHSAKIPGLEVNDFEIYEKSVYFCGEHESILYVDDIAVTDNHIIAAGHKHPQDGEYLTSFPRPTNPFYNIFNGWLSPLGTQSWSVYSAGGMECYSTVWDEDYLVAHIAGDTFATICHGGFYGSPNGTVLNLYNTASIVYNRIFVPDTSTNYRDLRFNKYTKSLYLLPGAVNSTLPDGYIEYVFDAALTKLNHVYKHHNNPGTDVGSLDAALQTIQSGYGQALVTSTFTPRLQMWRHMPKTGCSNMEEVDWTGMCTYSGEFLAKMIYNTHGIAFRTYLPRVEEVSVDKICGGNTAINQDKQNN